MIDHLTPVRRVRELRLINRRDHSFPVRGEACCVRQRWVTLDRRHDHRNGVVERIRIIPKLEGARRGRNRDHWAYCHHWAFRDGGRCGCGHHQTHPGSRGDWADRREHPSRRTLLAPGHLSNPPQEEVAGQVNREFGKPFTGQLPFCHDGRGGLGGFGRRMIAHTRRRAKNKRARRPTS